MKANVDESLQHGLDRWANLTSFFKAFLYSELCRQMTDSSKVWFENFRQPMGWDKPSEILQLWSKCWAVQTFFSNTLANICQDIWQNNIVGQFGCLTLIFFLCPVKNGLKETSTTVLCRWRRHPNIHPLVWQQQQHLRQDSYLLCRIASHSSSKKTSQSTFFRFDDSAIWTRLATFARGNIRIRSIRALVYRFALLLKAYGLSSVNALALVARVIVVGKVHQASRHITSQDLIVALFFLPYNIARVKQTSQMRAHRDLMLTLWLLALCTRAEGADV